MEQAGYAPMNQGEYNQLFDLLYHRKACVSGRTLWLGGTEIAYRRPASQFNCSFTQVHTIYDVVDVFWLLLQGCGVGFKPKPGVLRGFLRPLKLETIEGGRYKGRDVNFEQIQGNKWIIQIGDSAEAWAKSVGKLLRDSPPPQVDTILLDYSQIRPAGTRLNGYGWIGHGYHPLASAYEKIVRLRNTCLGKLFTELDIIQVVNLLGTVLSTRRSAQICVVDSNNPHAAEFSTYKTQSSLCDHPERTQSNNSLLYWVQPNVWELQSTLQSMVDNGGSEPGFYNGGTALKRAPWFAGTNPCGEILLPNQGFCNLCEINLSQFVNHEELERAIHIIARANYRQTVVNLDDGVLSPGWHQTNEALRLCGVGLTGIAEAGDKFNLKRLREVAINSAYGMADELGLERPKAVTTIKPSGTLSKLMDTTSGIHNPIGRYVKYNVNFSIHSEMCQVLMDAGYQHQQNPYDPESKIISIPIDHGPNVPDRVIETAIDQLERYKRYNEEWCDHNVSITVRYNEDEVTDIADWLYNNWDSFVGVSFILNDDTTYLYLPQELMTEEEYNDYTRTLQEISWTTEEGDDIEGIECEGGACPIR